MSTAALARRHESFNFEKDEVKAGVGDDSNKISEMITVAVDGIYQPSVGRLFASIELSEIEYECSEDNWDGDGAAAISPETINLAEKFIDALPITVTTPYLEADTDDSIDMEWYVDQRHLLTININREGKFFYAGLFGEGDHQKAKGSGMFEGELTPFLADLIESVYK